MCSRCRRAVWAEASPTPNPNPCRREPERKRRLCFFAILGPQALTPCSMHICDIHQIIAPLNERKDSERMLRARR